MRQMKLAQLKTIGAVFLAVIQFGCGTPKDSAYSNSSRAKDGSANRNAASAGRTETAAPITQPSQYFRFLCSDSAAWYGLASFADLPASNGATPLGVNLYINDPENTTNLLVRLAHPVLISSKSGKSIFLFQGSHIETQPISGDGKQVGIFSASLDWSSHSISSTKLVGFDLPLNQTNVSARSMAVDRESQKILLPRSRPEVGFSIRTYSTAPDFKLGPEEVVISDCNLDDCSRPVLDSLHHRASFEVTDSKTKQRSIRVYSWADKQKLTTLATAAKTSGFNQFGAYSLSNGDLVWLEESADELDLAILDSKNNLQRIKILSLTKAPLNSAPAIALSSDGKNIQILLSQTKASTFKLLNVDLSTRELSSTDIAPLSAIPRRFFMPTPQTIYGEFRDDSGSAVYRYSSADKNWSLVNSINCEDPDFILETP